MPFSRMPPSVKSGVGKSKHKQSVWMSSYESARKQGKSKETAAKIAYGAIRKEAGEFSLMSIIENAAEKAKDGKMIAAFVPMDLAQKLHDMFQHISGDAVQPKDMHMTLGLMRGNEDENKLAANALKNLSSMFAPFDMEIDHFDVFEPNEHNENKYILHAVPKAEIIQKLHDQLFDLCEKYGVKIDNGSFDFTPHITIKYCNEKPEIDKKLEDPVFRIKNISLASGDNRYDVALKGINEMKLSLKTLFETDILEKDQALKTAFMSELPKLNSIIVSNLKSDQYKELEVNLAKLEQLIGKMKQLVKADLAKGNLDKPNQQQAQTIADEEI